MSYTIEKAIRFEAGHRLMGYDGPCSNLHGHNYVMKVGLKSSKLDKLGMIIDFSDVKAIIKAYLDEYVDHAMILCVDDKETIEHCLELGTKIYYVKTNPTAESLCQIFYYKFKQTFDELDYISIEETPTSIATYRA